MALIPRMLGKDKREALDVSCWLCHHRAILSAEQWPNNTPVPAFGPLLLLADAANGCTQSILMAHGFAIGVLHDQVRDGLATATRENAIAARRGIVVTRLRITDAGRRALTCVAPGGDATAAGWPWCKPTGMELLISRSAPLRSRQSTLRTALAWLMSARNGAGAGAKIRSGRSYGQDVSLSERRPVLARHNIKSAAVQSAGRKGLS